MHLEQRYARVGQAELFYQVTGSGAPLVLVHGLSGSGRWWRWNLGPLGRHFRVYAIDLINFGRSRARQPFVLAEAASLLAAWMDRVGLRRAHFIGHSMGGFIAADMAATYPDRVGRLVLVDAAVMPPERSRVGHAVGLTRALRRLPVDFLPVLVADAYRAGPVTILKAALELISTDIRDRMPRIRAPVLVVWGERDTAVPVEIGLMLHRHLPGSRFVVLERAGHNPMWDRPEAFNRAVLDFLHGSSSPPSAST